MTFGAIQWPRSQRQLQPKIAGRAHEIWFTGTKLGLLELDAQAVHRGLWWPKYKIGAGKRGINQETSLREKDGHIRLHLVPRLGHLRLGQVNNERVTEFLGKLRLEGFSKRGRPPRSTLRTVLAFAVRRGYLSHLPDLPEVARRLALVAHNALLNGDLKRVSSVLQDCRTRRPRASRPTRPGPPNRGEVRVGDVDVTDQSDPALVYMRDAIPYEDAQGLLKF